VIYLKIWKLQKKIKNEQRKRALIIVLVLRTMRQEEQTNTVI